MLLGIKISTIIECFVAYLLLTYLWICKIVQQDLYELEDRLLNIQLEVSSGTIALTELALIVNDNGDTLSISTSDIPEGLIPLVKTLQKDFSFSPKHILLCYKTIVKNIEPKLNRWEKEIKKIKKNS